MRDVLDMHLSRHIGDYETIFSDDDGWAGDSEEGGPPVDILVIHPEGERQFAYICSFGCSFQALRNKMEGGGEFASPSVEFVLAAKQNSDETENRKSLNLAANIVRQFAKMAHLNQVDLSPGVTVMFSDEPSPLFEGLDFTAFAFIQPRIPADRFENLSIQIGDQTTQINFISPVPVFSDELNISKSDGPDALAHALETGGVTEMIDFSRASVVQPETKEETIQKTGFFSKLAGMFAKKVRT